MARIVYTIGEMMGSVGGLTFQRNSSGKIVRFRPTVGKKSTRKQQASHLSHNNLLRGWQGLTLSQKIEWNDYAGTYTKINKFGQEKQLTGANWYSSVNFWRNILSLSELVTPPTHDLPESPPNFSIEITDNSISINFLDAHDYVDSPVIIWASVPTLRNSNSINQVRKYVTIVSATPTNPLNITTNWQIATGINFTPTMTFPDANLFICLESVKASSGITSPMICDKINTSTVVSDGDDFIYYS